MTFDVKPCGLLSDGDFDDITKRKTLLETKKVKPIFFATAIGIGGLVVVFLRSSLTSVGLDDYTIGFNEVLFSVFDQMFKLYLCKVKDAKTMIVPSTGVSHPSGAAESSFGFARFLQHQTSVTQHFSARDGPDWKRV